MTKSLENSLGNIKLISKKSTVSTNSDAREIIHSGLTAGDILIVADTQTGGRGRQGKNFLSPSGGLYMTLALRCGIPITDAVSVTSCAAVAVCRAIEKVTDISCGIKWVNDIYLDGGKLVGILVESLNDYEKMTSEYLIIGVGVNIDHSPEIVDSPYNAACLADRGSKACADDLCGEIARELLAIRQNGFDFSKYIDEYISRSVVIGHEITFTINNKTSIGTAVGITDRGELIVQSDNREITLDSGEISVKLRP